MKLFFIFLFLCSFNIFAEDAEVIYSKGKNLVVASDGTERNVIKGDYLVEGETLKTSEKSFVILKIGKHSTHRVEENSEVNIEQLPYQYEDDDELEQGGSFVLKMGTVFSEIFKKSDNESFSIRTKNTTMGVRGTKLMASVDSESNDTWVSVDEGTVEIKNSMTNSNDLVEKDQAMVVENDRHFTRQQRYEWQKNLKWNIEQNKEDFKSFKQQRKLAYKEFRQRRSDWVRNEARWNKFKEKRQERLAKFKEKSKGFKSSEKLKKRRDRLQKLRTNTKEKRQLYNEGLVNKKKRKKQQRLNDFLNQKKFQDTDDSNQNKLQKMRQRRRLLRQKSQ